jgi:hypothetical protein
MALLRQSSFAGGEVAPDLSARTDLPARAQAVRTLRNFIPTPTGSAVNRAGFQYVGATKYPTRYTRLVPFTFSTSQSYVLEVGHLYVRIIQGGGYVQSGSVVEVTTPYTEAQLPSLRYIQSGDTVTFTHPAYPPKELRRLSQTSWTLADYTVVRAAVAPSTPWFTTTLQQTDDTTHLAKTWDWVVTSVVNDEESLPSAKLSPTSTGKVVVATDRAVGLQCGAVSGASLYHWYRGRYGNYGYIGNSKQNAFLDEGQIPNFSDQPPNSRNPFAGNEYPAVASYHQQRLVLANQPSYPQRVMASKTGAIKNHDYSIPQKDSDAIDFTVSSRQYEEIRALVSLRHLLVLTANTEFACDGGEKAFSPTNINLTPVSYNGCARLAPLVLNNVVLYLQAQQAAVRELSFDGTKAGWGGSEVSLAANHLLGTAGRTIVDWTYQRLPYSVIWAVRDDGKLLSLTYHADLQVVAWAQHDTQGFFESVCSVPEGSEDALYAVVRRTVNGETIRYVERMATRRVSDVDLCCFLDAAVWYWGAPANQFDVSHLGQTASVMALVNGVPVGPLTSVAGIVTLPSMPPGPNCSVFLGLSYNSDIELLDLFKAEGYTTAELGVQVKNVSRVIWEVDKTAGLSAGESVDDLQVWVPSLGWVVPEAGLMSEKFLVPITSSWNRHGRAVLRQSLPLPVTVVGVSRDVEMGSM